MKIKMKLNNAGISLLEVMVGMILLALGLLTMAPMVVLSIQGNNISKDVLSVSTLAKEKLEYYKGLETMPAIPYKEYEPKVAGGYSRTTLIRDSVADPLIPGGLYEVDIIITWTDKAGVDRSSVYSTYLEK